MIGIGGKDILDVNKKLILGILYQTMRAYTLVILQKCAESDKPIKDEKINAWVIEKLVEKPERHQNNWFQGLRHRKKSLRDRSDRWHEARLYTLHWRQILGTA